MYAYFVVYSERAKKLLKYTEEEKTVKKKFLLIGLCLTMAMSMLLAACGSPHKGKTNALSSPNDVYGMGAVSSVRLLGSNISVEIGRASCRERVCTDV